MDLLEREPGPTVIEVLFFAGCPGYEEVLPTAQRLAAAAGAKLVVREVDTPERAEAEGFLGSPTVRVDGVDVDPGAADRDGVGMRCRLYRWDGGQSRVPPEAWIRAALGAARARGDAASP